MRVWGLSGKEFCLMMQSGREWTSRKKLGVAELEGPCCQGRQRIRKPLISCR